MKNIIFKFSNNSKLIFDFNFCFSKCLECDFSKIYYSDEYYNFLLRNDYFNEALFILKSLLNKALNNQLQLHRSIDQDVGLLWNEELHNLVEEKFSEEQFWVGEKNLLWSTPGNIKPSLATWLYNDKDGNIIFEVTPTYYWNFVDPLPDEQDYITYEEFIKNYKPLLIEKISKETAMEWILKIDELMKIIQSNEKKFLSEHRSV